MTKTNLPDVTCALEIITPARAERMLMRNEVNRNLRKQRVQLYAKVMQAGHWRITGETIVFDPDGVLLQGQHRLHACIAAGISFSTIVVRGVDRDAMRVMDTGLTRTAGDALSMDSVRNATLLAAASRQLIAIKGGFPVNTSRQALITRDEILDFQAEHAKHLDLAVEMSSRVYGALRQSRSGWAALAFLLIEADVDLARDFFDGLGSGADMAEGDARLALRSWVLNRITQRRNVGWPELVATAIRVWNAWLDDRHATHVKGWKPANGWPEVAS